MSPPATSTLACETQVAGTAVSGHSLYRTTQIISYRARSEANLMRSLAGEENEPLPSDHPPQAFTFSRFQNRQLKAACEGRGSRERRQSEPATLPHERKRKQRINCFRGPLT